MGETDFLVVKNRAYTKLVTAIDDDDVSVVVTAGEGARFPSTYPFDITIEDEIMRCTNRVTDTLTVTRAQQDTSATAHSVGVQVALNITAKSITDLNTAVNFIEKYADYGLAFFGVVTTYTDTTHFKVAGLAGLGTSTFLPASGTPYEIFVFKADGAAPQGEQTPVVAYTTADGTFQHAAFTAPLAVNDEVLIIHPLLASLGTKATAAATGAVTDTDYMMAYIKQIVTELQAVDALVDAIKAVTDVIPDAGALTALLASIASILEDTGTTLPATLATIDTVVDTTLANVLSILVDYLAHGTWGLAAIRSALQLVQTKADDIYGGVASILVDYLAHGTWGLAAIRTGVAGVKTDTYNIDNNVLSIITDYLAHGTWGLNALVALINAVNTQVLVAQKRSGLSYWGVITAVDGNTFTSADLSGLGIDAMHGWMVYVVQADDAAPEGEYRLMTDYTNEGVVTHNAFSVALEVGDRVILLHPMLYGTFAATGGSGARSLETLGQEQDADLDVARGKYTKTMTGGEDNLYGESSDTEFCLQEFRVDLHNMVEGDSITFRVYTTEDGTERQISSDLANTYTGVQDPARREIIGSLNQVWGREDISITAEQTDGTMREIICYWRDAKRGS